MDNHVYKVSDDGTVRGKCVYIETGDYSIERVGDKLIIKDPDKPGGVCLCDLSSILQADTLPVNGGGQPGPLSQEPLAPNSVILTVNGQVQKYGNHPADYTVSGLNVAWNDSQFTLDSNDEVIAQYRPKA